MGQIYRIYCRPKNKSYIGRTVTTFEDRYQGGRYWATTHCQELMEDCYEHGREQFQVEILLDDPEVDETILESLEKHFIKAHNAMHPNGYNRANPTPVRRKSPEECLKQVGVRLHPDLIAAVTTYADSELMSFSEACRSLTIAGLRMKGVEIQRLRAFAESK